MERLQKYTLSQLDDFMDYLGAMIEKCEKIGVSPAIYEELRKDCYPLIEAKEKALIISAFEGSL